MRLDTTRDGLAAIFEPWQAEVIEELFRKKDTDPSPTRKSFLGSATIYEHMKNSKYPMSRASVIYFLKKLVKEDLIMQDEETCKGGTRGLYRMAMSRWEFERLLVERFIKKIQEVFPNADIKFVYHIP